MRTEASPGSYSQLIICRMKREQGLEHIEKDAASLVTVGSYDGIHAGHQAIVRYMVDKARTQGCRSTLLTFEPHPREIVTGEKMLYLTTIEEKAACLEALGLDRLVILEFTREFAQLSPEQFVVDILVQRVGVRKVVVGYNHGFGHGRKGNTELLQRMGKEWGFGVEVLSAQLVKKNIVSSSRIRKLLTEDGDVHHAADMLKRYYGLRGTVGRGKELGRTIGFSTANIQVTDQKIIPSRGVYAVRVYLRGESKEYGGMMNIGVRPTVADTETMHLEVHLLDFSDDIYGQELQVFFVDRLREEKRFDSLQELKIQLHEDERRTRQILYGTRGSDHRS